MKITTTAFRTGETIPARYSRMGGDHSPPLKIFDVPANAQSVALIVDDPDAPRGLFTHWIVFNLDRDVGEISEDGVPSRATIGRNDFGTVGYGGPKPPSGTHRYFFHAYALDSRLDLPLGTTRPDVDRAMKGHIIEEAEIMGRYSASGEQPRKGKPVLRDINKLPDDEEDLVEPKVETEVEERLDEVVNAPPPPPRSPTAL